MSASTLNPNENLWTVFFLRSFLSRDWLSAWFLLQIALSCVQGGIPSSHQQVKRYGRGPIIDGSQTPQRLHLQMCKIHTNFLEIMSWDLTRSVPRDHSQKSSLNCERRHLGRTAASRRSFQTIRGLVEAKPQRLCEKRGRWIGIKKPVAKCAGLLYVLNAMRGGNARELKAHDSPTT